MPKNCRGIINETVCEFGLSFFSSGIKYIEIVVKSELSFRFNLNEPIFYLRIKSYAA